MIVEKDSLPIRKVRRRTRRQLTTRIIYMRIIENRVRRLVRRFKVGSIHQVSRAFYSMKKLSLKRDHNKIKDTFDLIEVSDDDDSLSQDIQKCNNNSSNTRQHMDISSHKTLKISNSMTDASSPKYNSKHNISDDISSDEDVIVVDDVPDTSRRSQSMFNWDKPIFASASYSNIFFENNISSDSKFNKELSLESPNKRQKIIEDSISSDSDCNFDDKLISLNTFNKEPPLVEIQHSIMIAGTNVKFPVKPYSCQIAVMNSLIVGCNREQNCLLESPTGSGKTLALLCGALAWQQQYSEKICQENCEKIDADSSCCDDDSLNDNFFLNSSQYFNKEWRDEISSKAKSRKVPKIFYGTRTHKQIEQVIREFKKTAYRHKRMTILSSRDHTCIQNTNRNKNDLCHELLDPLQVKKCEYYFNDTNKKEPVFSQLNSPWDIEDLISFGKNKRLCPYFGARSLMVQADIVFCPYNYILYPEIRESMQINLRGNIVILDEAHNVEDICREAASVSLKDYELTNAAKECLHLLHKGRDHHVYDTIHRYLMDFVKFLKNVDVKEDVNGFNNDMTSKHWPGIEFRVLLDIYNIGSLSFSNFYAASTVAINDFGKNMKEEIRKEEMMLTISRETKKILEYLCYAMQSLASDSSVHDYRVYVIETIESTKKFAFGDEWTSRGKVRTFKLICMNPAIVFKPLALSVRSIILASGTLTPTTSFQSELDTQFPHLVNPQHIIPSDQVYVRCISQGPNGKFLNARYENMNTLNFQDELGELILKVCDAVPYGVLCFFSSYKAMNTLHERWKNNGMWNKLSELKSIFVEPKDNKNLLAVMNQYRSVIEESSSKSFREACGAILFAVFRGKIAEGIDFSDNEARCVLAVGIPFSYKNNDIDLKMKYNDSNTSKGLLSGSEWYVVNAFRALNQAIGRCVRHINDWGAVLLVDERFKESKNINYLPKWIRTNIKQTYKENYNLQMDLEDFVAIQVAREKGKS
ncbi:Fanconi anemia group J protein-like isoform X2 [Pogonomyrmex barbatus]|uniref:DNA 5'-3' helicase n=1 Tax=Pogonomyrmex barbatus TaxID=144034 RepID=A0A6I9X083_9HYME|nr:Fanconi anemia group J protein-like isoform X2 [Pogonomyrmex barbatus]